MQSLKELILSRSAELKEEVIRLRRHFHRHPELSYHEHDTSAFIQNWLDGMKIPYRSGIAGTGIIAEIRGTAGKGKIVAARAEMDALPVTEENVTGYVSASPGTMHACGHDAHMAMLMGVAMLLESIRDRFPGTVLLIFQPGEEKCPGGARLMIEAGAFIETKPDMFLANHVLPDLETGKIGYKSGRYMASCDEIYITVKGTGGHAALPGLTTDQVYIASKLVVRLRETMAERQSAKKIPTVLGIGRIVGNGATNVIPDRVEIACTFRTFDEKWRAEALDMIRLMAERTAQEHGVNAEVRIEEGYPVLVNDDKLTANAIGLSSELLGGEKIELYDIRMSSDDFSFYSAIAPSLYYRVGIRKKGTEMSKLHTSCFDIDEEGLETGVANMAWLMVNFLSPGDH